MSVEVMRSVIEAAEGRVPVDTLFINAQIVDVYGQRVAPGSVAVKDGVIVGVLYDGRDDAAGTYEAAEVIDCQGRYLAPGFIDGHLHIESSNIRPAEYARMAATRGTTTAIADSHEIANVAGCDGITYMMQATKDLPLDVFFMVPSCVPATLYDRGRPPRTHLHQVYDAFVRARAARRAGRCRYFGCRYAGVFCRASGRCFWSGRNDELAGRLYGRPRDLCSHRCCQPDAVQAG